MSMEATQRGRETLEDILGLRDIPAYFTTGDIARILQIDRSTVRRKCERGEYERAFKVGPDWRIPSRFFEKQLKRAEETGEFAG